MSSLHRPSSTWDKQTSVEKKLRIKKMTKILKPLLKKCYDIGYLQYNTISTIEILTITSVTITAHVYCSVLEGAFKKSTMLSLPLGRRPTALCNIAITSKRPPSISHTIVLDVWIQADKVCLTWFLTIVAFIKGEVFRGGFGRAGCI